MPKKIDAQDARQGRQGFAVLYVLSANIAI